ncbi:MAG TPA: hypothetical protein RMH99_09990 [Sandaracinaceae bacterium LLY-WYZ-13_1]|nr:hypothetical protein [Sandaracinaceae bacterium LLY-WYZ-13_1]
MRRTTILAASVLAGLVLVPACAPDPLEPGPGEILLRYEPAVGSTIRYHTVLREVPGDRAGRTVSASSRMRTRSAGARGARALEVTFDEVHLAGEGGSAVDVPGEIEVRLVRDALHRPAGEPEVAGADVEAAADLVRHLRESLVFPRLPFGVGDTWELPPLARPLPDGSTARFVREARLVEVNDGVARIAVTGRAEAPDFELGGATVSVGGDSRERFDVRVADGLLIERTSQAELRLVARLPDGTEVGTLAHRTRARTRRLAGATPSPEPHDWRPDRPDSGCVARLEAMERRFDHAPRGPELGGVAASDMRFPVRGDARDVTDPGPVIVGVDEETILGALAGADLRRALVAYVVAPVDVEDHDLRVWLDSVPATVELRRLAIRQVHPPSPPSSEAIASLAAAMRDAEDRASTWRRATAALVALCGPAREAVQGAGALEGSERAAAVRGAVVEAFGRCGCEATDLQRLERTLDLRLGGPHVGWVPL